MARTIVGLFESYSQAQQAVMDLTNYGINRDDISLVAQNNQGEAHAVGGTGSTHAGEGAGVGALSGGALGGVLGVLVGIGALAIPGIGPVIAAGPLAAALGAAGAGALVGAGTGAVTGGLLGALVGAGIPEEEAHVYAEGVRRGGVLVTVSTNDMSDTRIADVLRRNGAVDVNARGSEWRQSGWNRFDPDAGPYNAPSMGGVKNDWHESSKAGTASGTAAGAATGAAIGAAGGPVGAVVGGLAGAATGAGVGAAGDVAGEKAEDELDDDTQPRGIYDEKKRRERDRDI